MAVTQGEEPDSSELLKGYATSGSEADIKMLVQGVSLGKWTAETVEGELTKAGNAGKIVAFRSALNEIAAATHSISARAAKKITTAKAPSKNQPLLFGNEPASPATTGEAKTVSREDYIYNIYVREDEAALRSTLFGIGVDEQRSKKPVILAYDTGIEPNVDTTHVARAGEVAINKYLNGMVVEIRGTGRALLDAVRVEAQKMGPNYSVVTIAGDTTLSEIRQVLVGEGKAGDNLKDDLGVVINVQNPDNRYIPIIGLYDIALRIAYDLDQDAIVDRLNRIALNPNGIPFTKDDLLKGVIRILPRIAPANMAEAVEAYKAAQQALQSL
jgi:hypothetical protein